MLRSAVTFALIVLPSVPDAALSADLVIETVTVGDSGNPDDTYGEGYGGVDYVYSICRFEVTAGQYAAFLNAVAATDTYELYDIRMGDVAESWGCNIQRSGPPGGYTYSVPEDWADRPVNFVSWGDAARFANWMHNGQPVGAQDLTTTEDGAYFLDGMMSDPELLVVPREPDATWAIPSEDEWYKAAYYDGPSRSYYNYPTRTDAETSNELIDPDPGNNANYGYTIGGPYYRTVGGEFENSESPYGTFDQGGNVWEWNESVTFDSYRGVRGGSFFNTNDRDLHAIYRGARKDASKGYDDVGFRLVRILGPADLADLDGDGDVDLYDFALFQAALVGPRH